MWDFKTENSFGCTTYRKPLLSSLSFHARKTLNMAILSLLSTIFQPGVKMRGSNM